MKITIIGGGSYAWTPPLVTSFLLNDFFNGAEICLMDINGTALKEVMTHCEMLRHLSPTKLRLSATTSLGDSIRDTNYVIPAVAVGGLDAMEQDHLIGRKYGCRNIKGHDVGAAGFSRTLRHVPFMLQLAREMERTAAPGAMLLNVSNPLAANTMAVSANTNITAYGFCHGVYNHLEALMPLFGARSMDEVEFITTGVDHCSWLLDVKVNGKDALEIMKKNGVVEAAYRNEVIAESDDPFAGREAERLRFIIWDQVGYLPAISDDHICEFFPQFLKTEELRNYWNITYDRIVERRKTVNSVKEKHLAVMTGKTKPELTAVSEIIAPAIAAFHGKGAFTGVMNTPNRGQIPNLPEGIIVETQCFINSNGVHPITAGPLPDILDSIVRPVAIHEKMYMEAACEWNMKKAVAALSTDPMVSDFVNSKAMVEEYFRMNRNVLKKNGIPVFENKPLPHRPEKKFKYRKEAVCVK
jgi:alpha-galactosidase